MLDTVLEIAMELGGELLEAAIGFGLGRRKKLREGDKSPETEPWERKDQKLPWEK